MGQAAKAIIEFKGIGYIAAAWEPFEPNHEIYAWAGEASAPLVAWQGERPLHRWMDILELAERLCPEPSLLPANENDRALMFGLSNEICGRFGIGWNRRLQMVAPALANGDDGSPLATFGMKYGWDEEGAALAGSRVANSLRALARQLHVQQSRDLPFFIGTKVSALDLYWTAFSNLLQPMSPDRLPLPDAMRPMFVASDREIVDALDPILIEHRDRTFASFFRSPMEM